MNSANTVTLSDFQNRHIGPDADDIATMLKTVGVATIDALIDEAVPPAIRQQSPLHFGKPKTEAKLLAHMTMLASRNVVATSLIGQGYYGTHLPPVIQRNVLENPAWYTAYTPYQPEISQGRLEALLNFQTMIVDLTGLEIANASLLDEATAAAEAMAMCRRATASQSNTFFVDRDCHPQTIAVLQTRAEPLEWKIVVGDPQRDLGGTAFFGALLQYPGSSGQLHDFCSVIARLHEAGAIVALAADPLALALLVPPGELGADIAVGSTQRFGVPMGYGGPHAAYIATRTKYQRTLPGRLVGVTIDSRGSQAYRLALQTREQHIRREKATSNICTAQALPAIVASMYAVYHGANGLSRIAQRVAQTASTLAEGLRSRGWPILTESFFDTITVKVASERDAILGRARKLNLNLRRHAETGPFAACIGISCDETTTPDIVARVWRAFGQAPGTPTPATITDPSITESSSTGIPAALQRKSGFMLHPVFNQYHSETQMLRYLRRLVDRDLALDRTMIPLGSCTMKLNGTAEMMPLTWAGYSDIHPFVPADQARGYAELMENLRAQLCAMTGYDAVSLQPNSGAQGEYAGLLAIRNYHRSRGDGGRTICLIPTSAHGTNPASAQMAGMDVVPVGCDTDGNVDLSDLRIKAERYSDRLAVFMITYPSTHGVFETEICAICAVVHSHGGQVYLDGANLNALVGLAKPGEFGSDVSHFNLHKTFCIPHGGGGPGMGPIGVRAHLAPFLPGHPATADSSTDAGPVSAAPYGSASILTVAYAYILLMGGDGLTQATRVAILNANYIACRLAPHYPLLFGGRGGRVAHECIVDLRPYKETAGISVDDVAKRLIDYGFHAPTMSFPVAGTLMIEPTESESLSELDRFCDAMIAIRTEIEDIAAGRVSLASSPLRNAPHTARDLIDENWDRPYTRATGCVSSQTGMADKYWCPVNRIDNAYGDRNLMCSCPPMEHADVSEKLASA